MKRYNLNFQGEEADAVDYVLGPYDTTAEALAARDRIAARLLGIEVGDCDSGATVEAWVTMHCGTDEDQVVDWYAELNDMEGPDS